MYVIALFIYKLTRLVSFYLWFYENKINMVDNFVKINLTF